ncbi:hypothetical protein DOTSEDRAFT_20842 [Dothistroma septosporum NZE10]|uniref:Uncharacterized protein n=1 Tax=Dothistroma septosporum (strain NZE10 / CBS 128990) TaxID=675120 RepID=N1PU86_DOTSN|nr:hypothetical protein DOTSEDRAFT_20842 [Dothistroma septosporum NZE10]
MGHHMRMPRGRCEPHSVSKRYTTYSHILLKTSTSRERILNTCYIHHIVFCAPAPGSQALTAGQAKASDCYPDRLAYTDVGYRNSFVDTAACFAIFRKNTKPLASGFVSFTTAIGITLQHRGDIYRDVAICNASAIDPFGKSGVSLVPFIAGSAGRNIGWNSTIDGAVGLFAGAGTFNDPSGSLSAPNLLTVTVSIHSPGPDTN